MFMSNAECNILALRSSVLCDSFINELDRSQLQKELKRINDTEELADWFRNFNFGLPADFSLLTYNFEPFEEDAVLYEFMKKALSLGEEVVVFDRPSFGGNLVGKIIPNEEKPTVIVNWFDYGENNGVVDDFSVEMSHKGVNDRGIHVASQGDFYNPNAAYVAVIAGRFFGALNLAIENNKDLGNIKDYATGGYTLTKKM